MNTSTAALAEPVFVPVRAVRPVDADALSVDECLERLAAIEQHKAFLDAEQARILARLAARPEPPAAVPDPGSYRVREFVIDEIAAALTWSAHQAGERVHVATILVDRLPAVLDALTDGCVSWAHARVVALAVRGLAAETVREIQSRVLQHAPRQTAGEFRATVRRAVASLDPRGRTERHDAAAAERRVCCTPDDDSMAWLSAYLPAADAQTVMPAIQAVSDSGTADARTADQRRADALTAIAIGVLGGHGAGGEHLPVWQGRRPAVEIVVALSTLLGIDDQPGELGGYGPVPADLARRIAADPSGTWRRLVTDERGRLVDYGRTRYRPPQDLTDFVIARDRSTRGLGRMRSARNCHLDHIEGWARGGTTGPANIHALDARSHVLKHDGNWRVERCPDGTTRWTTPRGNVHDKPAETYPVDRTRTRLEPDPPPF
ncbi:MAG: DUF222 domain-containing protein [Jatrophihabitantaceae bacterium]